MKSNIIVNKIMDVIKKYIDKPNVGQLYYGESTNVVRISLENTSVAFIITSPKHIITHVDLCYQNCLIKKYIKRDSINDLIKELSAFVGQDI